MRTTLNNLQGLRGIACLLVLGIHMGAWESDFGAARQPLKPFRWIGFAGVDLFFVISGFIIAHTQSGMWGQPHALPGYLFRRFWRLYPFFWIVMLIAVPTVGLGLNHAEATDWPAWMTLTPTANPNHYIGPAWTLVYEVVFYAAFGVLMLLPRRVAPWALVVWAVAVGVAEILKTEDWFYAATIDRVLISPLIWEFLMGCAIAWAVRKFPPRYGRTAMVLGVIWAACGLALFAVPGQPYALSTKLIERVAIFGIASALLVYGAIAAEREGTLAFPRWLRATGDASYSIYLWHGPIGMSLHFNMLWWPHHTSPHLAWLAFMLLVCWGGGMLLHRWIERPLLNLAKRRPVPNEPVIVEARIAVLPHREWQFYGADLGHLGNRAEHVEFEGAADAVAANVLEPLVDDELIFPGYPELGSREDFDARLSRVHADHH